MRKLDSALVLQHSRFFVRFLRWHSRVCYGGKTHYAFLLAGPRHRFPRKQFSGPKSYIPTKTGGKYCPGTRKVENKIEPPIKTGDKSRGVTSGIPNKNEKN